MLSDAYRPAERDGEGNLDGLVSLCCFVVKVCLGLLFVWLWLTCVCIHDSGIKSHRQREGGFVLEKIRLPQG